MAMVILEIQPSEPVPEGSAGSRVSVSILVASSINATYFLSRTQRLSRSLGKIVVILFLLASASVSPTSATFLIQPSAQVKHG